MIQLRQLTWIKISISPVTGLDKTVFCDYLLQQSEKHTTLDLEQVPRLSKHYIVCRNRYIESLS